MDQATQAGLDRSRLHRLLEDLPRLFLHGPAVTGRAQA